jgi:hypothetical protein
MVIARLKRSDFQNLEDLVNLKGWTCDEKVGLLDQKVKNKLAANPLCELLIRFNRKGLDALN